MARFRHAYFLFTVLVAGVASTAVALRGLQEEDGVNVLPFPGGDSNIISGQAAGNGEFPWYAIFNGNTLCGGALLHEDVVVTAAHCIESGAPASVRIGATTNSNGVSASVCDSIIHPNFRSQELENDIAVLVLCDPVDALVASINTDSASPADGATLTSMGFGRTSSGNNGGTNSLQKIDMEYVPDQECLERFPEHNADFNLCADNPNGGICFGDSGSPIVDGNGMVYGVASFIIESCDSGFPDFYTEMSSYSTWVQRQICDESDNPPDNCDEVGDDDGPDGDGGGCFILDVIQSICDLVGLGDIFG